MSEDARAATAESAASGVEEKDELASFGTIDAIRGVVGGIFMGLANLVPGISGGTMLVATGIYPRFIAAIASVTRLKLRRTALLTLACVVGAALLAILLLAGTVKGLVVDHRWVMYSLFIGLTLGGVPVVWQMAKPATSGTWGGVVAGLLVMGAIAWFQSQNPNTSEHSSVALMFVAGMFAAGAMILPGISGGYLLLVLGVYVPILGAIDQFKDALKAGDVGAAMDPALQVVLPVGVGVVIGVVAVSNLLKMLLAKHEKPTLGVLLGFLVGATMGLWPFQRGVAPALGDTFKGQVVTEELLAELDASKYPTEFFSPAAGEIAAAIGLVIAGFALTALITKLQPKESA